MIKFILLVVYLYQSDPKLAPELRIHQRAYETSAQCETAGQTLAEILLPDEKFVGVYMAGCIEARENHGI